MSNAKVDIRRRKQCFSSEELLELPKNQLVNRIRQLEAHNRQLQNILNNHLEGNNKHEAQTRKRKRPFDFSKHPKQHIAIKLLYLGWDYHGLATSEGVITTIEHYLFSALQKTCLIESPQTCNYSRCGRTDKSVSAFSQVIALTVRAAQDGKPPLLYCKMINSLLPKDIRLICWRPVPDTFSARFNCKRRTYKYFFPRGNLDLEAMKKGITYLLGTHDFRNLCKMDVGGGVTEFIRTVDDVQINVLCTTSCLKPPGFDMCEFILTSRGFLWHQVRCIMALLILIGRKNEEPEIISDLLDIEANPRKPQYNLALGEPLNLFHTEYDIDDNWVVDEESLREVEETLQSKWAMHSIKGTMIGQMLTSLSESYDSIKLNSQSNELIQGVKSKSYIPLMKRPKCESLASRIQHFENKKSQEMGYEEQA